MKLHRSARRVLSTGATVILSASAFGCSADEEVEVPAICASVDSLESSVDDLSAVEIEAGVVADLQTSLGEVQEDLAVVVADAKNEYESEIDAVEAATSTLGASLDTALATPSVANLSAVQVALESLGTSLTSLTDAVDATC